MPKCIGNRPKALPSEDRNPVSLSVSSEASAPSTTRTAGESHSELVTREARIDGFARLVPSVGLAATRPEAASRLCESVRALTGAAAAALFLDEGVLYRAAASGFDGPLPEALRAASSPDESESLRRWSAATGHGRIEIAPVEIDEHRIGLLVLFGGNVEPLLGDDLRLLGSISAHILENARTIEELRRAYETQDRTQDQVVRTERLRVVGEMALGIAHDFNNVLNAVLGQVGVLELLSDGQPALGSPIERLKQVALDGARTVSRLQDFSRQRRDQEFIELDLSELAHASVLALRQRGTTQVALDESLLSGVRVAGNASELREALSAVFDNAIDAKASHVEITVERSNGEARIVIADDGAGMSREVRKRAFDPFFTTKGSLASGLGLSVAYGIVRRHGGRIELESTPGQGTKVRIRLPALKEITLPSVKPVPGPGAGGIRILLIEDDEDNREAMSTLLGLGGHAVTSAATAAEGIRLFAADSFDLVLTDLGLPDLTGWEVARQVKELSVTTPVALITGWGLNLAQDEIHRRGVDLLIKKPIEPRKFLQQLSVLGVKGGPKSAAG